MKRFESVKYSDKQKDAANKIKFDAIELEKSINAVRKKGATSAVHNYLESALQHLEIAVMLANKGISRNDNFL